MSNLKPVPVAPAPIVEPPAPARPTPAQRRMILAVIEENAAETCYKGACSDEVIAQQLNLPAAWVGSIRDEFLGWADTCEHDLAASEHAVLASRLEGLRADHEDIAKLLAESRKALEAFGAELKALAARTRGTKP